MRKTTGRVDLQQERIDGGMKNWRPKLEKFAKCVQMLNKAQLPFLKQFEFCKFCRTFAIASLWVTAFRILRLFIGGNEREHLEF